MLFLYGDGAKGTVTAAKGRHSGLEIRWLKIGPEGTGEAELRVRALPEEEVAEALLPTGTDEKIDGWKATTGLSIDYGERVVDHLARDR